MSIWDKIINFFHDWISKLTDVQKRRVILICTAVFSVLLAFSVIMSMRNSNNSRVNSQGSPERMSINIPIPAEELFLPDEPDFLPEVILERDRRSSWTEQDVAELGLWQDPLRYGEEQWREAIEDSIDDLMERVP